MYIVPILNEKKIEIIIILFYSIIINVINRDRKLVFLILLFLNRSKLKYI